MRALRASRKDAAFERAADKFIRSFAKVAVSTGIELDDSYRPRPKGEGWDADTEKYNARTTQTQALTVKKSLSEVFRNLTSKINIGGQSLYQNIKQNGVAGLLSPGTRELLQARNQLFAELNETLDNFDPTSVNAFKQEYGVNTREWLPKLGSRVWKRAEKDSIYDKMEITIECNRAAMDEIVPLLEEMKAMGSIGSSRSITIEDWSENGEAVHGFDGDGPSKISDIKTRLLEADES